MRQIVDIYKRFWIWDGFIFWWRLFILFFFSFFHFFSPSVFKRYSVIWEWNAQKWPRGKVDRPDASHKLLLLLWQSAKRLGFVAIPCLLVYSCVSWSLGNTLLCFDFHMVLAVLMLILHVKSENISFVRWNNISFAWRVRVLQPLELFNATLKCRAL